MTKTLDRPLFKKIKNDHRSTGITSGLAYRPGYKVGGRVGFKPGGAVDLSSINPNLRSKFESQQKPKFFSRDPSKTLDIFGGQLKTGLGPSEDFKIGMSTDPEYQAELIRKEKEEKKLKEFEDKQKIKQDAVIYDDAIVRKARSKTIEKQNKIVQDDKDKKTIKPKSEALTNTMYDDMMATKNSLRGNRDKLDSDLQALREKQRKDNRLNIALKTLQAMNDPNLKVGQSRVAAGVGAFTDEVIASNQLKAEQQTADMLTKYNRLEDDIARNANLEDYFLKQDYIKKYGQQGVLMQEIAYALKINGFEEGSDEEKALVNRMILKQATPKDFTDIKRKIADTAALANTNGEENEWRTVRGIAPKFDSENKAAPLTSADVDDAVLYFRGYSLQEQNQDKAQDKDSKDFDVFRESNKVGGRVGYKVGGRVGYDVGGDVDTQDLIQTENKKAPMVMTKDQLRKKLPEFIDDEIVSLIAYSPNAFADFASIQTRGDADDFNDKYDVRLELPELDRMNFSGAEEKVSAPTMPITAPAAVSAQPNTATQMGAGGNLTPTEVALLDPTEQAIRMRNR